MTPSNGDRRKRPRVALGWRASIRKVGQTQFACAETVNLSAGGVYCLVSEPFHLGECLELLVELPEELDRERRTLRLRCLASVVRMEPAGMGTRYGIACSIQDYGIVAMCNGFGSTGAEGLPQPSRREPQRIAGSQEAWSQPE